MRGDSLRDLYAKALALLGLGLLGVAGALVDYWPVRGELPAVASVLSLPAPIQALTNRPDAPPSLTRARPVATPVAMTPHRPAADPILDTVVNADLADVLDDSPAPSLAPPPPPSLAVVAARLDSIPSSTLSLMPPVIVAPEAFLSVPPVASPSSGDNLFEAAAKTAGRVGLKTGSAIANGFKAFGHVFRWPL